MTQAALVTTLNGSVAWLMDLRSCYKANLSTLTFCPGIVLSLAYLVIRRDSEDALPGRHLDGGAAGKNPDIRLIACGRYILPSGNGRYSNQLIS